MSGQHTGPNWLAVGRDLVSFAGGWALILKQAGILFPPAPPAPSVPLLVLAACLVGVPQVAWLLSGWRRGDTTDVPSGGPPSLPTPPSAPSLPTSSSAAGE